MAKSATKTVSLPPATGGWDTQNALADMPASHAPILDNWFPDTDVCKVRKGFTSHATGMTGDVSSLIEYVSPTGAAKLFAGNGTSIFDVTTGGAVGAAAVSGLTNAKFQSTQISTSGGHFALVVNGEDTPRTFNGSAWASASISGPTAANLIWCNNHQRRLWFGEKDSLSAWYLAVNSISGTATEFPLGAVAKRGGYLMAMGTWSRDSGAGADDVAVFLTSEGEAIVYAGTDPASAATWALVGVFHIGRPIGRRCMLKNGADLVMVTNDGFVNASSILYADRSQAEAVAISSLINKTVTDAARDGSTLYGWQPIVYPAGSMLLFNVPQTSSVFHQYVFNTLTRAACRFTGVNAVCWGMLGDDLYFGSTDGKVHKFDSGNSDDGTAIEADCLQAFNSFRSPGSRKRLTLVEPIFQSDGAPTVAIDLNLDYHIGVPTSTAVTSHAVSAVWGVGLWGLGVWGSASEIYRGWKGIRGIGRAASLRMRISTSTNQPSWLATNWLYTSGGPL